MRVQKRRRRENKTDYLKRIKLLGGGFPRIVFRKTNKYFLAQYVTTKEAQDRVRLEMNSRELLKLGWPKELRGSLKSTPASYLLGLSIGKRIAKEKLEKPILDFGMIKTIHKSKIYAFLKGLIDAGLDLKHEKDIFPSEDRIKGKNLKEDFSKKFEEIKSKIEAL